MNVSEIAQLLAEHGIEQIILIPHRDLHRFPLHHLFDAHSCTYFPSAHLALTHHQRRSPAVPLDSLLLVENPKSTPQLSKGKQALEPLPFAEAEAALIQQWMGSAVSDRQPAVTLVASQEATFTTVTTALQQPHHILHFTGHGTYDSLNPSQSCLFLAGSDRLTLSEIVQLDLSVYHLVCLAACETAVTGDQTITAEYVGLMSAFLKAGVGHVLSTLWRVESVTSMLMMVQFYRELQHQPPVIALRAAQAFLRNGAREQFVDWLADAIALLSTNPANRSFCILLTAERDRLQSLEEEYPYAHPYYWAAFHIAGAI
ncbi:CHAT domain-containing protein [Sphaerothrix gracilis]|uniref:CHAT domain-containing protein n=1 Tax=Sphaerothrix gracilis TaxID=3151835 RepID=UPI0031FBC988